MDPDHRPARRAALRQSALPGPVRLTTRVPLAERVVLTAVVPLLSVPVLLATMGALWCAVGTAVLTAVVATLCSVRCTLVGADWVADRRLLGYRVTASHGLTAARTVPTAHGDRLELRSASGRVHRLRVPHVRAPHARTAVAALLHASPAAVCPASRSLLGMPERVELAA